MDAKPPFQLLIVDDEGRQVFSTYVSVTPEPYASNIQHIVEANKLTNMMIDAIKTGKVEEDAANWMTV